MLRTNKDKLPIVSVQGQVWQGRAKPGGALTYDGKAVWLVSTGGITYNAKIGDICVGWAADHLEPGVSTKNSNEDENVVYQTRSCVGNVAEVRSGDAKGAKGIVTGKHGGAEHLMIYFDQETLEKLDIGDKILVRAVGQGMELLDHPEILLRNLSPDLLEKMNITEAGGKLKIGVAKIVPAEIMGSGLGSRGVSTGDYDITLFDEEITKKHGLDTLRFGDIVAIINADNRYGRQYKTGAVSIGVVIHGDCVMAGHGPGVTTLMTCKTPLIEAFIDPKANLADFFIK